MKFIDIFSGIGGFRLGMEMAGHECIGHCEIDKYANRSYIAMHRIKESEWFADDITAVLPGSIPNADVWCFGFPCQDISVAGKQRGLEGARSGLFYTVIELIKSKKEKDKPSILLIENVKNLLSVNNGWDFARILISLDEAGYDAEWELLNSKDYGVPQNRERVFIIGHLRGRSTRKVFPITEGTGENIKQLSGGSQGYRVYDPSGISCSLTSSSGGVGGKTGLYLINVSRAAAPYHTDTVNCLMARDYKGIGNQVMTAVEVRSVLTPERMNKRQNGRRIKAAGEPMFTLTSQDRHGVLIKETTNQGDAEYYRIRRLTPRECFRLQGFPDDYFDRASAVNSDTQLYRQAGNSVTVPVVYEIARKLEILDTITVTNPHAA